MVFSSTMDNQEDILDALNKFEKKPSRDEIPPILEQFLCRIAKTGETLFPWPRVKPLFVNKFIQVATQFYQEFPSDNITPSPNVENLEFEDIKRRICDTIEEFTGAPFTIQRLCELLTDPHRHYKRSDKFLRGIEKNVQVISTVDPFGNKVVNETRVMVNGLNSPPNSNQVVPPQVPVYSSFPSSQTNWPTDSWAGVHLQTENSQKSDETKPDVQSVPKSEDSTTDSNKHVDSSSEDDKSENLSSAETVQQEDKSSDALPDHNGGDVKPTYQESHDGHMTSGISSSLTASSGSESDEKKDNEELDASSSEESVEEANNEIIEATKSSDSLNDVPTTSTTEQLKTTFNLQSSSGSTPETDLHINDSSNVTCKANGKNQNETSDHDKTGQCTVNYVQGTQQSSNDSSDISAEKSVVNIREEIPEGTSNTSEVISDTTTQDKLVESDVEVSKCENSSVTTSEDIQASENTNSCDSILNKDSEVGKEAVEDMNVDSEGESQKVISNAADSLHSEGQSSDISSSSCLETPMEED